MAPSFSMPFHNQTHSFPSIVSIAEAARIRPDRVRIAPAIIARHQPKAAAALQLRTIAR
jgi:hypothetical protein